LVPSGGLWRALPREGPGHSEDELFTCVSIFTYIYWHIYIYIFICHTIGIKIRPERAVLAVRVQRKVNSEIQEPAQAAGMWL